jgi:hypothetical protein
MGLVDALESFRIIGIGLNSEREPAHGLDGDAGFLCRHAACGVARSPARRPDIILRCRRKTDSKPGTQPMPGTAMPW